jgi:hypothetical protein
MNAKIDNAVKLYEMGVPFNMINQRLELGFADVPGGDDPKPQAGSFATMGLLPEKAACRCGHAHKSMTREQDSPQYRYWKSIESRRLTWEERIAVEIRKAFSDELNAVERAYLSGGLDAVTAIMAAQRDVWRGTLAAIYKATITYFANNSIQLLLADGTTEKRFRTGQQTKAFNPDPWKRRVERWVEKEAGKKAVRITDTTTQVIRESILEGLAADEGSDGIARRMRNLYDTFNDGEGTGIGFSRAMTIARTETTAGANYGHREGAVALAGAIDNPMVKTWISSGPDGRTREEHLAAEAEGAIPLDQPYGNGLMFPGDPTGEPELVINCRCVEGYDVTGDLPEIDPEQLELPELF